MIRVGAAGVQTTLQDLGRFGHGSLGVGSAGAMDSFAARVANVLVANDENATLLEITLGGVQLEIQQDAWFALSGADCAARLDDECVAPCRPFWIAAGQVLRLPAARSGCRTYLAVQSGFAADSVLGSHSTDIRAQLGGMAGRALQRGDLLRYGAGEPRRGAARVPWFGALANPMLPASGPLDLIPGPAWAQLIPADRAAVEARAWGLDPASDRMGLRLCESLESAWMLRPILSRAVGFGTVQLPPDGRPIILGADRQTTGGYPILGVVASIDHTRLAQARPGDRLRFKTSTVVDAQARWREREQQFARWRTGVLAWWRS